MKNYNIMHNVGRSKYIINYHDGVKTHKDGSKFYDLATFKNKKDLNAFVQDLNKKGYKVRY